MSIRVALVTGAASPRGIGYAIALRLADDGLDIAISDLPSQKANLDKAVEAISAKGRRAVAVTCDVSVENDVKDLVQNIVESLGSLDVVRIVLYDQNRKDITANNRWWQTQACSCANRCSKVRIEVELLRASHRCSGFSLCRGVEPRPWHQCPRNFVAVQVRCTPDDQTGKRWENNRQVEPKQFVCKFSIVTPGASSVGGKRGHPNASAYSASKFAIRGLTQAAGR